MTIVLRAIAIGIAVAALVDPVLTVQRARSPQAVLVNLSTTGSDAVTRELREVDPALVVRTPVDHRVPCEPGERCFVVADGSRAADVPADTGSHITLIRVKPPHETNITLESATAGAAHSTATAGTARVAVRGVTGQRAQVRISDEGAVIGSAPIEWKTDSTQTVDVPWWPIAAGARVLRVEVAPEGDDRVTFDNAIDLPVTIDNRPHPVLVFDARPSWNSTFVRRAVENDARFVVDHRARVAPALTTGTANGRLDPAVLDAMSLLIVGAPDALTNADVELIERFVRLRGGSVILLPERAPSGSVARLFPGEWSEQLLAEPEAVGVLRAGELLRPRTQPFGALSISPVVVAAPVGNGRIVVAGAMDAWRYRDAGAAAFDHFFTSLAAESAALGGRVRIEFDEPLPHAASRSRFIVRYHAMSTPDAFAANAIGRCVAASQPAPDAAADAVRLWPDGQAGAFRGELPIGSGACTIEVAINGAIAQASIAAIDRPQHGVSNTLERLAGGVRATGGTVTDEDNLQPIRALNISGPTVSEDAPAYPMRSVWWLLPFAGCLSAEWWIRRRSGLK